MTFGCQQARYAVVVRIALVSPYSWSYRGGVNRHVEALARELDSRDHFVRVLAPSDPEDAVTRLLHRNRMPAEVDQPDFLVPLGRTLPFGANGAVSNLGVFPDNLRNLRRELKAGEFDVVHVHEPAAPLVAWDTNTFRGAPVVGTFHAYSTKPMPNYIANGLGARRLFNQLTRRIAVSEAAAWTGKRWFGGEYEIVPNGVDFAAAPAPATRHPASDELRLVFLGRAEERKGLGVLLTAFAALIEQVPARLTVVGATRDEVNRLLADPEAASRIDTVGRVSDEDLWRHLGEADLLCAPSLSGESFGMVLIEAFAAGTPVVASNIAGYSDVVTDGVDGVLVPPADPQRLAEVLRDLWHEPERIAAMGEAGRKSAERYAWPRVTDEICAVYESALVPARPPVSRPEAIARRTGLMPIDGSPSSPPKRMPSLDPIPETGRGARLARKAALGVVGVLGVGLTALAAQKVGLHEVAASVIGSDISWVLLACALMVASLFLRAASWMIAVRSALPGSTVRRRDVASATMIGVFMSATLPARLGEPARAMVLSRRVGRMRETFAVIVGTLVSQTAMNIFALVLLGVVIVSTSDLFQSSTERIFIYSMAPVLLLIAVLIAPVVIRPNGEGRVARIARAIRQALDQVRSGLSVFRHPKQAIGATAFQLGAWALQLGACWALFAALGIQGLDGAIGLGAAAAVLFAVNVTAVVPVTPSNIGVFQLAVVSVLSAGFGVEPATALAYGVILQAVEVATAALLGVPSLVREGVSWSDMRLRALQAAPVRLQPRARRPDPVPERASAG